MKRLFLAPLLALSVLGAAPRESTPSSKVGVIVGAARRQLIADWDAQIPGDLTQRERAYCVSSYGTLKVLGAAGDTIYVQIVSDLSQPVEVTRVSQWGITFACPPDKLGRRMPTVHTHPATLCNPISGTCMADSTQMLGGKCGPSALDTLSLNAAGLPFAVVQCGREVWQFYGH